MQECARWPQYWPSGYSHGLVMNQTDRIFMHCTKIVRAKQRCLNLNMILMLSAEAQSRLLVGPIPSGSPLSTESWLHRFRLFDRAVDDPSNQRFFVFKEGVWLFEPLNYLHTGYVLCICLAEIVPACPRLGPQKFFFSIAVSHVCMTLLRCWTLRWNEANFFRVRHGFMQIYASYCLHLIPLFKSSTPVNFFSFISRLSFIILSRCIVLNRLSRAFDFDAFTWVKLLTSVPFALIFQAAHHDIET